MELARLRDREKKWWVFAFPSTTVFPVLDFFIGNSLVFILTMDESAETEVSMRSGDRHRSSGSMDDWNEREGHDRKRIYR